MEVEVPRLIMGWRKSYFREDVRTDFLTNHYVEKTYKPVVLPLMAKTTKGRYEGIIKDYLDPEEGRSFFRIEKPLKERICVSPLDGLRSKHGHRRLQRTFSQR